MLKCLSIRYERAAKGATEEWAGQLQLAKGPVGTCVSMFCPQSEKPTTPMTKQFSTARALQWGAGRGRSRHSSCTLSWQQLQSSCRVVVHCLLFGFLPPFEASGLPFVSRLTKKCSAHNNSNNNSNGTWTILASLQLPVTCSYIKYALNKRWSLKEKEREKEWESEGKRVRILYRSETWSTTSAI